MILNNSLKKELVLFKKFEQDSDTRPYIRYYSHTKHLQEFQKPEIIYKTIRETGRIVGFMILILDDDNNGVELRRIVVSEKGKGYGKMALRMLELICRKQLKRRRIWLDVYDFNSRGIHIYENCGYRNTGIKEEDGKILKVYHKLL